MKKVAVVTNYYIQEKAEAAVVVANKLISLGTEVIIPVSARDRLYKMNKSRREFRYMTNEKMYANAELIIVLGGDGSILEASKNTSPRGIPILGINLGRVGYMAELELCEIDKLADIVSGNYSLDERSMLDVEINNISQDKKIKALALNDVVLSNGSVARIVDIELYEEDDLITTYRADGLIISTPTGSTAYSMSAGGPIAHPQLQCFCVTPICSHSLMSRPMLFPDNSELIVKNVCQREKMLYLTVDGKSSYEVYRGDTVKITKSEIKTKLVRLKYCSFYKRLRTKLCDH